MNKSERNMTMVAAEKEGSMAQKYENAYSIVYNQKSNTVKRIIDRGDESTEANRRILNNFLKDVVELAERVTSQIDP